MSASKSKRDVNVLFSTKVEKQQTVRVKEN